jgi:hypothetical protein
MEQALSNKRSYLAVLTAIVLAVSLATAAPPVLAAHGNDNHWKASITPTSVAADTEVEFVLKFENDADSQQRIAELEVSVPAGFVPVLGSFVAVPNQPTSGFTPPCQGNHAWNVDFNAATGVIKVKPQGNPHRLCPGGDVEVTFRAQTPDVAGGPHEFTTDARRPGVVFGILGPQPAVTVTGPGGPPGNGPRNGNGNDDDDDVDDDDDDVDVLPEDPIIRDICPQGEIPPAGFTDVGAGNVHAFAIDCIAFWGITIGMTEDTYGPALSTTRGHMASFLARTIEAAGITLNSPRMTGSLTPTATSIATTSTSSRPLGSWQGWVKASTTQTHQYAATRWPA